jgi:hypothetical protein
MHLQEANKFVPCGWRRREQAKPENEKTFIYISAIEIESMKKSP